MFLNRIILISHTSKGQLFFCEHRLRVKVDAVQHQLHTLVCLHMMGGM